MKRDKSRNTSGGPTETRAVGVGEGRVATARVPTFIILQVGPGLTSFSSFASGPFGIGLAAASLHLGRPGRMLPAATIDSLLRFSFIRHRALYEGDIRCYAGRERFPWRKSGSFSVSSSSSFLRSSRSFGESILRRRLSRRAMRHAWPRSHCDPRIDPLNPGNCVPCFLVANFSIFES